MLNIYELEKKHRLYKLKSLMPYIVIFVSLSLIIMAVLFMRNSDILMNKVQHNQIPQQKQSDESLVLPINKQTPPLVPSLNFISNIKNSPTQTSSQSVTKQKEIKEENLKQEIVLPPKEPEFTTLEEPEKINPLKIERQNTQNDLNHVLDRFNKNNNPALSLFIAKKYYEMHNYHQSYNYALITNRINDNIDASWIIFAKSLVKLGRKDEAVETLKSYFEHSKSTQAKTLLEEIERGKFR